MRFRTTTKMRSTTKILIAILLLAAFLRFWELTRGDPINDEVLMGFRAIGLIDFDLAEFQTTPWEWFDPYTITRHCVFGPERNNTQVINQESLGSIPVLHMQNICNAAFGVDVGSGIPWWTRFSWHDHPPLVFYIEHFSFALFGENLFALRFPSALLGVVSVYLVYLLGTTLFKGNEWAGLISALLFAITLNAVYISRTGMQEPYAIFFILLSCYFFLCALEKPRYFLWTGVAVGVGFLAKYTVLFFTAPLFFLYVALLYRNSFRQKQFWLGAGIVFLFTIPMIIYNIMLYRAVGHFDFQFSALFFQDHLIWQVQPGKEIGSLVERGARFIPNLMATNSRLFLTLAASAIIGFCISLLRNIRATIHQHSFLVFAIVMMFLLLLGIGPSYRFLTMLTPFLALMIGGAVININPQAGFLSKDVSRKSPKENNAFVHHAYFSAEKLLCSRQSRCARVLKGIVFFGIVATILFEIFYSWNNQISYYPIGSSIPAASWQRTMVEPLLFSKARYENYNWGYNELGRYFENEFRGKVPAVTFDLQYQFLEQLRDKALVRGLEDGKERFPALVVVYGNFDKGGKLWALDRLHIYHAWPIINLATYYDYLREQGNDFYTRSGFKYFYFVIPVNTAATPEFNTLVSGIDPLTIKNPRGDTVFLVYKK